MGWQVDVVLPRQQEIEAFKIGVHVAVGRRHHRRRPAHDVIAGEQRFVFIERET